MNIERELQGGALGYFGYLRERNIRAPLPGLAKNITLAVVDEVRLLRIIGRDRAVQSARLQQRQPETIGIEPLLRLSENFSLRFAPWQRTSLNLDWAGIV